MVPLSASQNVAMETETTILCPSCRATCLLTEEILEGEIVCPKCEHNFPAQTQIDGVSFSTVKRTKQPGGIIYNLTYCIFFIIPGAWRLFLREPFKGMLYFISVLACLAIGYAESAWGYAFAALFWFLSIRGLVASINYRRLWQSMLVLNPRTWRIRFSIRTLLIITFIICLPLSWFGFEREKYRRQLHLYERLGHYQFGYSYVVNPSVLDRIHNWLGNKLPGPLTSVSFELVSSDANDAYLLRDFPNLSGVYFDKRQELTDAHLRSMSGLGKMYSLSIPSSIITDRGADTLTRFTQLDNLHFASDQITDNTLKKISSLSGIKTLDLSGSQLTGDGILHLTKLHKLRSLTLKNVVLSDEAVAALGKMNSLEILILNDTSISDAHLERLSVSQSLRELTISSDSISDLGAQRIIQLPKLEHLHIASSKVTNSGIAGLKYCSELRRLTLRCPNVTSDGLECLFHLPNLCHVRLTKVNLRESGLSNFSKIPELELLECIHTGLCDADLQLLPSFEGNLKELNLDEPGITDHGLKPLTECYNLKRLFLRGTQVTDEGLLTLSKASQLVLLDVSKTSVSDDGLRHLKKLPLLRFLDLDETKVTGSGFKHLQEVPNLLFLRAGGEQLIEQELNNFPVLPNLQCLELRGSKITDTVILRTSDFPALHTTAIKKTKVSRPALENLRKRTLYKDYFQLPDQSEARSFWPLTIPGYWQ